MGSTQTTTKRTTLLEFTKPIIGSLVNIGTSGAAKRVLSASGRARQVVISAELMRELGEHDSGRPPGWSGLFQDYETLAVSESRSFVASNAVVAPPAGPLPPLTQVIPSAPNFPAMYEVAVQVGRFLVDDGLPLNMRFNNPLASILCAPFNALASYVFRFPALGDLTLNIPPGLSVSVGPAPGGAGCLYVATITVNLQNLYAERPYVRLALSGAAYGAQENIGISGSGDTLASFFLRLGSPLYLNVPAGVEVWGAARGPKPIIDPTQHPMIAVSVYETPDGTIQPPFGPKKLPVEKA